MSRPTEAEVRAEPAGRRLDAWVHRHVFRKRLPCIHDEVTKVRQGSSLVKCGGCGKQFGDTTYAMAVTAWPAYSTDPAACAELRRHLWASGKWQFAEARINRGAATAVLVSEPRASGPNAFVEHREPIGTDPIAAEMLAWCKVALLASAPVPNSA